MTDTSWLWTAKAAGAAAGSAISIAYVLPGDRREAAVRFAVGVASGLVFGGTAGLKIAVELGIEDSLRPYEMVLMRRNGRAFDIETVHDPDESGRYLVCTLKEHDA